MPRNRGRWSTARGVHAVLAGDEHLTNLKDVCLQKGHRLLKNLEAKTVSCVFSPGFSALCHLWLMLGSEREN